MLRCIVDIASARQLRRARYVKRGPCGVCALPYIADHSLRNPDGRCQPGPFTEMTLPRLHKESHCPLPSVAIADAAPRLRLTSAQNAPLSYRGSGTDFTIWRWSSVRTNMATGSILTWRPEACYC